VAAVSEWTAPKSGWYAFGISATGQSGEPVDVQSITFDSVPGGFSLPETCCVCGSADVTYHNYRDQPFCPACTDPPYRMPWKRRLSLAARAVRGRWP
jgi:hypothetical protein